MCFSTPVRQILSVWDWCADSCDLRCFSNPGRSPFFGYDCCVDSCGQTQLQGTMETRRIVYPAAQWLLVPLGSGHLGSSGGLTCQLRYDSTPRIPTLSGWHWGQNLFQRTGCDPCKNIPVFKFFFENFIVLYLIIFYPFLPFLQIFLFVPINYQTWHHFHYYC